MYQQFPVNFASVIGKGPQFEQSDNLDTPDAVNLTGKELGEILSLDTVVPLARHWYRANLQGSEVFREGFGKVTFGTKGLNKVRFGLKNDLLKASLMPAIKTVIEKGRYHGSVMVK